MVPSLCSLLVDRGGIGFRPKRTQSNLDISTKTFLRSTGCYDDLLRSTGCYDELVHRGWKSQRLLSLARTIGWVVRWTVSVFLLTGGILVLSLHPLYPGIWWLPLALHRFTFQVPLPVHSSVCAIAATTLTTALFVGWPTFRVETGALLVRSPSDGGAWPLWLVLYAATVGLLASLLNHRLGAGAAPVAYSLAAAVLTFAAAASWCLAAMPARFWLNWLGHDPQILPVTIVAAGLTYLGGHHLTGLLMRRLRS